jgi:hypothetical protein
MKRELETIISKRPAIGTLRPGPKSLLSMPIQDVTNKSATIGGSLRGVCATVLGDFVDSVTIVGVMPISQHAVTSIAANIANQSQPSPGMAFLQIDLLGRAHDDFRHIDVDRLRHRIEERIGNVVRAAQ